MGLPVLTFKGRSFAGRVAASLLNAVQLPEMITTSQTQYESLAIELAKNPKKLENIRFKLKNNLSKSVLFNSSLFTQHLEAAYLTMYEKSKKKLNKDHIKVLFSEVLI